MINSNLQHKYPKIFNIKGIHYNTNINSNLFHGLYGKKQNKKIVIRSTILTPPKLKG